MSKALGSLALVLFVGWTLALAQDADRAEQPRFARPSADRPAAEARQPAADDPFGDPRAVDRPSVEPRRRPVAGAPEREPADRDAPQRKRAVLRLQNMPAADMASVINRVFGGEDKRPQGLPVASPPSPQLPRDVIVVPEVVSNSLVVSAAPQALEEIAQIVRQLDQRPPMVTIRMVIAEVALEDGDDAGKAEADGLSLLSGSGEEIDKRIRELQKSGRLEVLSQPRLMTLDNRPALIHVGERVPVVQLPQGEKAGQMVRVTYENVGLMVGVTPRINVEGIIAMEIDAEKSEVLPTEQWVTVGVGPSGEAIRSPRIARTMAQTTVSAKDGQTLVLGGLVTKSKARRAALWFVLTPQVVQAGP